MKVWFITGASSPLGTHLCRSALDRGDKVIATVPTDETANYLETAYSADKRLACVKITSDTPYSHIRSKIQNGIERLDLAGGRIDYLIHCPSFTGSSRGSPNAESELVYRTNSFSYTVIQVTKAVVEETGLRWTSVIFPEALSKETALNDRLYNTLEGTTQLLVSEYRSKGIGVSIVNTWNISPPSNTAYQNAWTYVVHRILAHMLSKGPSERGIRVM